MTVVCIEPHRTGMIMLPHAPPPPPRRHRQHRNQTSSSSASLSPPSSINAAAAPRGTRQTSSARSSPAASKRVKGADATGLDPPSAGGKKQKQKEKQQGTQSSRRDEETAFQVRVQKERQGKSHVQQYSSSTALEAAPSPIKVAPTSSRISQKAGLIRLNPGFFEKNVISPTQAKSTTKLTGATVKATIQSSIAVMGVTEATTCPSTTDNTIETTKCTTSSSSSSFSSAAARVASGTFGQAKRGKVKKERSATEGSGPVKIGMSAKLQLAGPKSKSSRGSNAAGCNGSNESGSLQKTPVRASLPASHSPSTLDRTTPATPAPTPYSNNGRGDAPANASLPPSSIEAAARIAKLLVARRSSEPCPPSPALQDATGVDTLVPVKDPLKSSAAVVRPSKQPQIKGGPFSSSSPLRSRRQPGRPSSCSSPGKPATNQVSKPPFDPPDLRSDRPPEAPNVPESPKTPDNHYPRAGSNSIKTGGAHTLPRSQPNTCNQSPQRKEATLARQDLEWKQQLLNNPKPKKEQIRRKREQSGLLAVNSLSVVDGASETEVEARSGSSHPSTLMAAASPPELPRKQQSQHQQKLKSANIPDPAGGQALAPGDGPSLPPPTAFSTDTVAAFANGSTPPSASLLKQAIACTTPNALHGSPHYAGPTFHNSPAPSSLPIPDFLQQGGSKAYPVNNFPPNVGRSRSQRRGSQHVPTPAAVIDDGVQTAPSSFHAFTFMDSIMAEHRRHTRSKTGSAAAATASAAILSKSRQAWMESGPTGGSTDDDCGYDDENPFLERRASNPFAVTQDVDLFGMEPPSITSVRDSAPLCAAFDAQTPQSPQGRMSRSVDVDLPNLCASPAAGKIRSSVGPFPRQSSDADQRSQGIKELWKLSTTADPGANPPSFPEKDMTAQGHGSKSPALPKSPSCNFSWEAAGDGNKGSFPSSARHLYGSMSSLPTSRPGNHCADEQRHSISAPLPMHASPFSVSTVPRKHLSTSNIHHHSGPPAPPLLREKSRRRSSADETALHMAPETGVMRLGQIPDQNANVTGHRQRAPLPSLPPSQQLSGRKRGGAREHVSGTLKPRSGSNLNAKADKGPGMHADGSKPANSDMKASQVSQSASPTIPATSSTDSKHKSPDRASTAARAAWELFGIELATSSKHAHRSYKTGNPELDLLLERSSHERPHLAGHNLRVSSLPGTGNRRLRESASRKKSERDLKKHQGASGGGADGRSGNRRHQQRSSLPPVPTSHHQH